MSDIVGKTIERYPKLPVLLANTAVGKIVERIENGIISPTFNDRKTIQNIQSWPKSVRITAEWILYLLGGAIRTMPDKKNPVAIMMQEALVETLTHTGMKIAEISEKEQKEIMSLAFPEIRRELTKNIKIDHKFRDALGAIFGKSQEWNNILQEADDFLSQKSEEIKTHSQARKARGWRRFFI